MTDRELTQTRRQGTVADIETEIGRTRGELGATVDELSHRLDAKSRAQQKGTEVKAQAQAKVVDARELAAAHPREAGIAAGAGVALLGLALIRRRRG